MATICPVCNDLVPDMGGHVCKFASGLVPGHREPPIYIPPQLDPATLERIEKHLSRLADAAESPFWRLCALGKVRLFLFENGWEASTYHDSGIGTIKGIGPTPQAAVEKFDEAFRVKA